MASFKMTATLSEFGVHTYGVETTEREFVNVKTDKQFSECVESFVAMVVGEFGHETIGAITITNSSLLP